MSIKDPILVIINEAKIYRLQGLFKEARLKFEEARKMIMNDVRIRNNDALSARIDQEISNLDEKGGHQGDMISFDQLPSDTRTRIQQLNKGLEIKQEEAKNNVTGHLPSISSINNDQQTILDDIITIEVTIGADTGKSSVCELDVTFQDGDRLSVVIPKKDLTLAEMITVGTRIDRIRYLTSNAILEGKGLVISCNEIKFGPKREDHSLTLQVVG